MFSSELLMCRGLLNLDPGNVDDSFPSLLSAAGINALRCIYGKGGKQKAPGDEMAFVGHESVACPGGVFQQR